MTMPLLEELRVALTPPKPKPEPDDLDELKKKPRFGPLHITIALISAVAIYLATLYWPFKVLAP